jgi:hypothetical protein
MKKLDTSTILRFLDAVGTNGAQFRHRGRTTTFMLFNNFRSLRTLVGGTEFELVPMSARLVFNKKVRSINAALLADVVGVYMAFSCRIDADALIGRHLALSMPGFELTDNICQQGSVYGPNLFVENKPGTHRNQLKFSAADESAQAAEIVEQHKRGCPSAVTELCTIGSNGV